MPQHSPDTAPLTTTPDTATIAVIGLGYVGLPLAVAFGRNQRVIGFDINERRIGELKRGEDHTLEVSSDGLAAANHLHFTTDRKVLEEANVYIVTVPTPVDEHKRPDLTPRRIWKDPPPAPEGLFPPEH